MILQTTIIFLILGELNCSQFMYLHYAAKCKITALSRRACSDKAARYCSTYVRLQSVAKTAWRELFKAVKDLQRADFPELALSRPSRPPPHAAHPRPRPLFASGASHAPRPRSAASPSTFVASRPPIAYSAPSCRWASIKVDMTCWLATVYCLSCLRSTPRVATRTG